MLKILIPSHVLMRNVLLSPQILSCSASIISGDDTVAASKRPQKKKKIDDKIILINEEQKVNVISLTEAQKIADRKNFKLVRSVDSTMRVTRPVYKLMSGSDYFQEDKSRREDEKKNKTVFDQKGVKRIAISADIGEHDLRTKLKQIVTFVTKRYEVRGVITGDSIKRGEDILSAIEKDNKGFGKITQKQIVRSDLKFRVIPIKPAVSEDEAAEIPKTSPDNSDKPNA